MPHFLHIQHQSCRACGREETFSSLYIAEALAAPGRAQKLLPAASIGPKEPVQRIELPHRFTPICAACCTEDRAIDPDTWARWQDALMRKHTAATRYAATPTKKEESLA